MCLKLLQTAQPHGSLTVVGKVVTAAWASMRHQAGRFKLRVCRTCLCFFYLYHFHLTAFQIAVSFSFPLLVCSCPVVPVCPVFWFPYCESRFHLKHEAVLARLLWDPSSCFHISKLDIRLSHLLLSPSCIMLAAGADCLLFKSIFTL